MLQLTDEELLRHIKICESEVSTLAAKNGRYDCVFKAEMKDG